MHTARTAKDKVGMIKQNPMLIIRDTLHEVMELCKRLFFARCTADAAPAYNAGIPGSPQLRFRPAPEPVSPCPHAYPVSAQYRPAANRTHTRHIPPADTMSIRLRVNAHPFVRHYFWGPACVRHRRFPSCFTAGEGLGPFKPWKGREPAAGGVIRSGVSDFGLCESPKPSPVGFTP